MGLHGKDKVIASTLLRLCQKPLRLIIELLNQYEMTAILHINQKNENDAPTFTHSWHTLGNGAFFFIRPGTKEYS